MQRHLHPIQLLFLTGLVTTLVSCADSVPTTPEEIVERFMEQLIEAKNGDVIELPAGNFSVDRGLELYAHNVTIRGAGMDETVLNFADQFMGAQGLLVSGDNFTIEDLAIEDTKGDALKITKSKDVVIRRVRAEWTNGPDTKNGAYGLYPVQVENLLVEDSVAIAASDAGIYVGQSDNIIVRRNRAEYNVAGIEIENSVGADVYENVAINNTGGILVFNMPNIPKEGHSTRVYDNQVTGNNTENFAAAGTAVASVPKGSGIVINSNDKVEVFNNDLGDNDTANIILASYYSTGYEGKYELAEEYDPFPETIFIYGNRFEGGGGAPGTEDLQTLKAALYGDDGAFPDVIWDGFINPEKASGPRTLKPEYAICIDNGDVEMLDVDGPNGYQEPVASTDAFRCQHEKLGPVDIGALGAT